MLAQEYNDILGESLACQELAASHSEAGRTPNVERILEFELDVC